MPDISGRKRRRRTVWAETLLPDRLRLPVANSVPSRANWFRPFPRSIELRQYEWHNGRSVMKAMHEAASQINRSHCQLAGSARNDPCHGHLRLWRKASAESGDCRRNCLKAMADYVASQKTLSVTLRLPTSR